MENVHTRARGLGNDRPSWRYYLYSFRRAAKAEYGTDDTGREASFTVLTLGVQLEQFLRAAANIGLSEGRSDAGVNTDGALQ
jgi:hypothetical protein